jgi:hypothetical protein
MTNGSVRQIIAPDGEDCQIGASIYHVDLIGLRDKEGGACEENQGQTGGRFHYGTFRW